MELGAARVVLLEYFAKNPKVEPCLTIGVSAVEMGLTPITIVDKHLR